MVWEHSGKTAIVGIGHSPTYRRWDESPETSMGGLALQAARQALEDAGLTVNGIDGVISSPGPIGGRWGRPIPPAVSARFNHAEGDPEDGISKVTAGWLARNLGIAEPKVIADYSGMFGALVNTGVELVISGECSTVMLVRPLNNFEGRYQHGGRNAESTIAGPRQFTIPYGYSGGMTTFSNTFNRYLAKYHESHDNMADFAVNNRDKGLLTEWGYYYQHRREHITRDDYINGRQIATPLNIYDADLPIHVAGVVILTTAERARDLRQPPAYVRSTYGLAPAEGEEYDEGGGSGVVAGLLETIETRAALQAKSLYERAGLGPRDMGFANLYDGFLLFVPHWIEAFGFCRPGEGVEFTRPEHVGISGTFPINPHGGNNGVGRSHGVNHYYEAVLQIRKQAGLRQVKNTDACVVVVGPPPGGESTILTRDP